MLAPLLVDRGVRGCVAMVWCHTIIPQCGLPCGALDPQLYETNTKPSHRLAMNTLRLNLYPSTRTPSFQTTTLRHGADQCPSYPYLRIIPNTRVLYPLRTLRLKWNATAADKLRTWGQSTKNLSPIVPVNQDATPTRFRTYCGNNVRGIISQISH